MQQPANFVFFWKPQDRNGIFSNWYPSPFSVGGVYYHTSEHYMMAEKARLMGDLEVCAKILANPSPSAAKKYGRDIKPWNEALWEANRERIMYDACLAKFGSSPALRQQLLSTGDAILVEASPLDRIWGIGMESTHVDAKNPERWLGLNLLGQALMRVRTDLVVVR